MAPGGVCRVAGTGHVLLLLSVGVHAFQWTSDIQNGGKLQRCAGDNVTFPWSYVTESAENVIVQFWFSNRSGSFASYFADNFMTSWDRVTQAGPAEVTLSDVSPADDDTYGVSLMLYEGQEPLTQHLTLTVAEPPRTTDGQLHVTEHINNSTSGTIKTSRPHMRLQCGEFLSLGSPPVSVLWTDPSGHRLPSTTFHDGYFYLDLDPHARGGNYTCSVQREAEATHCLASDSPLLMAVGWELVTMETMVMDQGAELRQLRRTLEELRQQVSLSHVTHTNTSGALCHSVTALEQGQTNRTEVLEGQVAELHNTQAELRQSSAEQNKTLSILVNRVSELQDTNTALRQASAEQNNTISSLQSHVADLQEQNANQNTQISGFQKQVLDQNTHISSLTSHVADQNTQIAGLQKQNTNLSTQIPSIETENAYLNIQISGLKKENADQNTQISGLQKQNADLNTQISGLKKENADQNIQISSLETENADLNAQISGLKKENADQKTQIFSLHSDLQTVRTHLEKADVDISRVLDDLGQNLTLVTSQLMTKTDRLLVSQNSLSSDVRAQTQQVTSLQTSVSSLQGDVKLRGTTLTTLRTELERINALTAPLQNKAGFYVYLATSKVTANQPVVFKLGSHVGGGYDARSGVYTAPYSGWYTLQAQLFPYEDSDNDGWFDIVHNSVNKARAGCYQKDEDTFTCLTSISMYVAKGDRLWVKPHEGGKYWTSPFDSFFTGVLVTPD